MKKVLVRIEFRGTLEISDEAAKTLAEKGNVNLNDIELPWDDLLNLDGEVEEY